MPGVVREQGRQGRGPEAARGLRAHQMWRVEMWPWRMFFSRTECSDTSLKGKSTSMSRGASGLAIFQSLLQETHRAGQARRGLWF